MRISPHEVFNDIAPVHHFQRSASQSPKGAVHIKFRDCEPVQASTLGAVIVSTYALACAILQLIDGYTTAGAVTACLALLFAASAAMQGIIGNRMTYNVLFAGQAIALNAVHVWAVSIRDGGQDILVPSLIFKLLSLLSMGFSYAMGCLTSSIVIDAVLLFSAVGKMPAAAISQLGIVCTFGLVVTACAVHHKTSMKLKRSEKLVRDLHRTLRSSLDEGWDGWLGVDSGCRIIAYSAGILELLSFTPLSADSLGGSSILNMIVAEQHFDGGKTTHWKVQEAFRQAQKNKGAARVEARIASGESEQVQVELMILCSDSRCVSVSANRACRACPCVTCEWQWPDVDKQFELPDFVVGIRKISSPATTAIGSDKEEMPAGQISGEPGSVDGREAEMHLPELKRPKHGDQVAQNCSPYPEVSPGTPMEQAATPRAGTSGVGAEQAESRDSNEASVLEQVRQTSSEICARSNELFDPIKVTFRELRVLGKDEHWIVDPLQFSIDEGVVLGSGSFGSVIRANFYGTPVALKIPRSAEEKHLPLLNELRTLRRLRHPNIVLFLGAHLETESTDMALVFELIEGHTLKDWLGMQQKPLRIDEGLLRVIQGMALALRYLHHQPKSLVHGDLKSSNVFVEVIAGWPRAKLGDFGLARILKNRQDEMGGSLRWMAPEIVTGADRAPSPAADIFSLGCLMSFTLTGDVPFAGLNREQIIRIVTSSALPKLAWPEEKADEQLPSFIHCIRETGNRCYSVDPGTRPSILEISEILEQFQKPFNSVSSEIELSSGATPQRRNAQMLPTVSGS
eukprot:TRINITY_DN40620_c0_g1_i1.p1 TRINITY_DN40620_c0_g1~~TRINITY_DN40620_c0_g1_i1.p1  ORF type:complete len:806 (+),score=120.56 TRINITY_DN40620_c0_g1_i1:30-2420(+)